MLQDKTATWLETGTRSKTRLAMGSMLRCCVAVDYSSYFRVANESMVMLNIRCDRMVTWKVGRYETE